MKTSLIIKLIENLESSVIGFLTAKERATKLKVLLKESLEKNKSYDLFSGAQEGLVEMFGEIDKKELSEEIEMAILQLEHFESTGKFSLINITDNNFSQYVTDNFNVINSKLKLIIEQGELPENY